MRVRSTVGGLDALNRHSPLLRCAVTIVKCDTAIASTVQRADRGEPVAFDLHVVESQ